jgi:hypothetical protein
MNVHDGEAEEADADLSARQNFIISVVRHLQGSGCPTFRTEALASSAARALGVSAEISASETLLLVAFDSGRTHSARTASSLNLTRLAAAYVVVPRPSPPCWYGPRLRNPELLGTTSPLMRPRTSNRPRFSLQISRVCPSSHASASASMPFCTLPLPQRL